MKEFKVKRVQFYVPRKSESKKAQMKRLIQESLDVLKEDLRVERFGKTDRVKLFNGSGAPLVLTHATRGNNHLEFCVRAIRSKISSKRFKVDLTPMELYEVAIRTPNCPLCGCELVYAGSNGHNPCSASLDRINNEKEVNRDNSWVICKKCNTTKSNRTLEEFKAYCREIGKI